MRNVELGVAGTHVLPEAINHRMYLKSLATQYLTLYHRRAGLCCQKLAASLNLFLGSSGGDTAWFETLFVQLQEGLLQPFTVAPATLVRLMLLWRDTAWWQQRQPLDLLRLQAAVGDMHDPDPTPAGKMYWLKPMAAAGNRRQQHPLGRPVWAGLLMQHTGT